MDQEPMNVTCNSCGWVHLAVTRAYAEEEVRKFNEFYDTLSEREQQEWYHGRRASVALYEGCYLCNGTEFRPTVTGDCPPGCTIQPVICELAEPGPVKLTRKDADAILAMLDDPPEPTEALKKAAEDYKGRSSGS